MKRNSVHMASGLPDKNQVISGMRSSCQVICEVDTTRLVYNDIPLFIAPQNEVILSPGIGEKGMVPAKYLRAVFDVNTRKMLHQAPIKYGVTLACEQVRQDNVEVYDIGLSLVDLENKKVIDSLHVNQGILDHAFELIHKWLEIQKVFQEEFVIIKIGTGDEVAKMAYFV